MTALDAGPPAWLTTGRDIGEMWTCVRLGPAHRIMVMRVLFASTGGSGHFQPLIPFIDACTARGDEVLVVGPPKLEAALAARAEPYRIGGGPSDEELGAVIAGVSTMAPRERESTLIRELFGRLCAGALLPAVEEACDDWRPDLVLHEVGEYASVIAADRRGIPHAQISVSAAEMQDFALGAATPVLEAYATGLVDRLRASPFVSRFPGSLDPSPFAGTRRYHDAGAPSGAGSLPDWWEGNDDPLVYLTLGTEAGGLPDTAAVYRAALEAVGGLPVRVLLTAGRATDVSALGPIPANVRVEAWVPQADVLAEASVVLCHGGSGTTFGAVAAGLPLVILPLFADQPVNARLVGEAGAGLAVTPAGPEEGWALFGPQDVPRIRAAVESVLKEPSYRAEAERLAAEMRGTPTVARVLADLTAELVPDRP